MTRAAFLRSSDAAHLPQPANTSDLDSLYARLREEIRETEPVVTAAVLACCAFRMRDEEGLVEALRALSQAVDFLERARAAA